MTRTIALLLALTIPLAGPVAAQGAKPCPPGLAKREPACVPPGQARKGLEAPNRAAIADDDDFYADPRFDRLQNGDIILIDSTEFVVVESGDGPLLRDGDVYYRLPDLVAADRYVRVGDSIVRVDRETRQLIEILRLADLLIN